MALTNSFAQKEIPQSILKEAKVALSFYPQLENVPIVFKFKKNIKKSTMQAQPIFGSLFTTRKKRRYVVLISERFKIAQTTFLTKDIPEDIMIGWLGHELGHIMDYKNRSSLNLIWFGIKYYFSSSSIKDAERTADGYAVNSGMEKYILKTKDFILNQAGISEKYKERIKRLYLSPEEIMELVEEREALNLP
ncbi:MAG: hypothetical protein KJO73_06470 [Croceitalea sp.]|nr:hypothetical protein [Croceitalea sp.]